uniref:Uncharacterized protein n=1 Tax=Sipha flava TaxID=143950 RepID=A0A2S2QBU4_9HEMI
MLVNFSPWCKCSKERRARKTKSCRFPLPALPLQVKQLWSTIVAAAAVQHLRLVSIPRTARLHAKPIVGFRSQITGTWCAHALAFCYMNYLSHTLGWYTLVPFLLPVVLDVLSR